MSDFPESLDIFADKTGADSIASSDPNNSFDGIENIEGFIGAIGKPQSWSTTLVTLLRRYARGMRVDIVGGTLYARAGEAVLENTDGTKFAFRRNVSDVTLTTANIDVGTIVATFYYVYATAGAAATTSPIMFSTDINAPSGIGTAPYLKIGWFNNTAAGSLAATFAGSWREFNNTPNVGYCVSTSNSIINSDGYGVLGTKPMDLDFCTSGGPVEIGFNAIALLNSESISSQLLVDGVAVSYARVQNAAGSNLDTPLYLRYFVNNLTAGAHTAEMQFKNGGGTPEFEGGTNGRIVFYFKEL